MAKQYKFEQISQAIEEKIYKGILKVGDKLPSVRTACQDLAVSPSTIFKAYYELEAQGLIEARSKSGYYVNLSATQQKKINLNKERTNRPQKAVTKAKNVDEMIEEIEESKLGDIKMDFSSSAPSVEMLPINKLNKSVRSSLLHEKEDLFRYEKPQGSIELRNLILSHIFKTEQVSNVEDIVITAGCLEAVNICLGILTKAGDAILTDDSNYYNLLSLMKNKDVEIYTYPFSQISDFDDIEFEEILLEKKIKLCLITPNFHNPTGLTIPSSIKEKIVSITTKNNVFIIEDDIYVDLYFGKNRPATLKQFDTRGLVYYCSSFSKNLAPGFRIGFCIPGNQSKEFAKRKRLLSFGTNSIAQAALVDFMKTGRYDLHLKSLRKKLHINMLKYGDAIINYFPDCINFDIPKGGYVFWIAFPQRFDSYQFYRKVLIEKILITPGEIFSSNGFYKNFIRISYSNPYTIEVERALKKIGQLAHLVLKEG